MSNYSGHDFIGEDEGNPFGSPAIGSEDQQGRSYDYSDGGTYEDLYLQDGSGAQQSAGQQPNLDYNSRPDFEEDKFPGQGDVYADLEDHDMSGTTEVDSSQQGSDAEVEDKSYQIWNIEYYSKYFDVDSTEVGVRIIRSLIPFSYKFMESVSDNPDLWGPFWIATTLIFGIAAASNFAAWIHDKDNFRYDFETVTVGAGTIYGYLCLAPIILWAFFKWLGVPLTFLQNVCIYGYSLFVFLPVSGLCILPFGWLRWVLIGSSAALSVTFLLMNFAPPIFQNKYEGARRPLIVVCLLAAIGLAQLALALAFKLYFFNYS